MDVKMNTTTDSSTLMVSSPKPLNGVCKELLHLVEHLELELQEVTLFNPRYQTPEDE